jgi:predicted porin
MAVLAASGASFAQATITGNLTSGYKATSTGGTSVATKANAATDASGLGIDTAEFYLNASEDLGGGLTAKAKIGLADTSRTTITSTSAVGTSSALGGDSVLSIGGGFGTVALQTTKGTDYLSQGIAGAGVGFDMAGKLFAARTVRDAITYTSPNFSGFTVGLSHAEPSNVSGLGVGSTGSGAGRENTIALNYSAGPLKANTQYTASDNYGSAASTNEKSRLRLSGQYDLGVAVIGAGFSSNTQVGGLRNDYVLAVNVPLGKASVGAIYGNRNYSGYGTTVATVDDGTQTGYGLTASYSLSKRTSVLAGYGRWDGAVGASNQSSEYSLYLSHSF